MSKALTELIDGYNDLLIQTLNLQHPDQLLVKVLMSIEDTHNLIAKGLLR